MNTPSLFSQQSPVPKNKEDWLDLRGAATHLFTPYTPIDEQELFAGRFDLLERLIGVVFQRGQHAVVFGERGVGKSSLANIIKDKIFDRAVGFKVIKKNCTKEHDFKLIWQHVFSDYDRDGQPAFDWLEKHHNAYDVYELVSNLSSKEDLIIIIDEFDRINDQDAKVMMADAIKYLSDYGVKATVILVGVAKDVAQLFAGHESISRNLEQIAMPKMEPSELKLLLADRFQLLNMKIEPRAEYRLIALSQGFPGLTHLLGQTASLSAIGRHSLNIEERDLEQALSDAISKFDETIHNKYADAIRSTKPGNQYRQALLACALARTNTRGYFSAGDVRAPFSKIMGRKKDIPSFARHLNEFCKLTRGPALEKRGQPKAYEYSFSDPLLRPYVVIRGIADELISHESLNGN